MSAKPTYEQLEQRVKELEKAESKWKKAEQGLLLLKNAIEQAQEGIAIADMDGYVVYTNPSWAEMHGLEKKKLPGQHLSIFHTEEQNVNEVIPFNEIVVKNGSKTGEVGHVRQDGTIFITSMTSTLLTDKEGNPAGVIGTIHDITKRKQAEKARFEGEQKFREIIEVSRDMHWRQDFNTGEIDYMSSSVILTLGYSHEEIMHMDLEQQKKLIHPEDLSGLLSLKRDLLDFDEKGIAPVEREFRMLHKSGGVLWIHGSYFLTRKHDGQPKFVVGVLRDITKEKQTEDALRASERNYREIFDNSSDAIFVHDAKTGALINVNRKVLELFGYTFDEICALHVADISVNTPPYTQKEALEWIHRAAKEGTQNFEWLAKTKNGRLIWFENSLLHAVIAGEERVLVFGRYIDERKKAEDREKKLRAQLQQAQKMESVGRLAGGVAHDFNNMLSIILGYSDLTMEQVGTENELYGNLEEIRNAARRSADIAQKLLAFARKQTISPKVIDVNQTVTSMIKMLSRLIGEDIDLAWLPEQELWPVLMDPSQIDQILANLCVNARDAITDVGKITIKTGKTTLDETYCDHHPGFVSGDFVTLTVSDTGCGIKKETMDNLFEPFFTTKDVDKGTGLGLATVYGIVKQNNGFINVYSEHGLGATFKIYIPRHMTKPEKERLKGAVLPNRQGNETILLVEDELPILKITETLLRKLGYNVLATDKPGEAISIAMEHAGHIDLLMTDVIMPEMNGRDLARSIVRIYPNLRRIFMSGYTMDIIAHHGVLDTGVNFIQKPFSMHDLSIKVREVLDR